MQIDCASVNLSAIRSFCLPARCPHCGEGMVAPVMSEFVESGEIRHHWECDDCGERSCTTIRLARK